MAYRVGPKGQVVVPRHIRDLLGIVPGDEVDVDLVGDEVRIRRRHGVEALLGLAVDGASTADLEAVRARERTRDRAREQRA
jgi:AbrB family looped-hinge helix DNA binding protein